MTRTTSSLVPMLTALAIVGSAGAWSPPAGPAPQPESDKIQLPDPFARDAAPSATGSLAIRAIQRTPDGPAIGSTKVEVQLYGREGFLGTLERMLDGNGVIIIEDIPIGDGVQPVVIVHHAGVTYQRVGTVMDQNHATQTIEVNCYELTEQTPAWTVSMRHVMLEPVEGGLRVVELLTLKNPDDRTWHGVPDPAFAAAEKRVTTRFALPETATDVQLGKGFHDWCCTTKTDEELINHLPLMPTGAELSYSYVIPASDGRATVDIVAPAPTDHTMVIVPKSADLSGFLGLEYGGEQVMDGTPVQYLVSTDQDTGARAAVSIDGLGTGAALSGTETVASSRHLTKIVAGVGGGLIVLATFLVLLIQPSGRKEPSGA